MLPPQKSRFLDLWKTRCCASQVSDLLKQRPDVQAFLYESSVAPYEPSSELQNSLTATATPEEQSLCSTPGLHPSWPYPAGSPCTHSPTFLEALH